MDCHPQASPPKAVAFGGFAFYIAEIHKENKRNLLLYFLSPTPSYSHPLVLMAKLQRKSLSTSSPSTHTFVSISRIFFDHIQEQESKNIPVHVIEEMMEKLHSAHYEIPLYVVAHEDRYKAIGNLAIFFAAQALGREKICIEIRAQPLSLLEQIEHVQNPIALAKIYARALRDLDCTQEQLSSKLGKSRPSIANTLRLLSLPLTIRQDLQRKELLVGHGLALLRLGKEKQQILHQEIHARKYTVKESEDRAKELSHKVSQDQYLEDMCSVMIEQFDARAKIHQKGTCITITFSSTQELLKFLKSKQ